MKKSLLFFASAALLFACTPGEIVAPGGDTPSEKPTTVNVTGISLDQTTLTLKEGESATLVATVAPDNATNKTVTWTSSNEAVATVDNSGKVTGVKAGTATITATANDGSGKSASCSVTINSSAPVSGEAVDLGLPSGLKWAASNLSETGLCSNPWDYGDYYAWGETEPYYSSQSPLVWKSGKTDGYNWSSYKWCKGSERTLTKYCPSGRSDYWAGSGSPDNKRVLDLEDDVACVKLGGKWRMPTDAEWNELWTKCTWTWKSNYNGTGVNGWLVTGPNGNSIFLPAAGNRDVTYLFDVGSRGYYWSSSLNTDGPGRAWYAYFNSGRVYWDSYYLFYGRSVRPVFGDCYVSSVTLNESSLSLEIGQSYNLIASVSPDYASDRSLTWRSSDESIATVDQSGKVTAKSKGKATIKVAAKDGSNISAYCALVVSPPCPPGAVDLGLKTSEGYKLYWATCNLCENGFVSSPEEYGDYYAWGETEPYYSSQSPLVWKSGKTDGYDWSSYKWCKGDYDKLTKYCPSGETSYWAGSGSPDNRTVLNAEDDVANVKLGGKWRMPTYAEWIEIKGKCTWTWKSNYNGSGVNGRLVTGPNGNSIFLPAAGNRYDTRLRYVGSSGYYWSSSLDTGHPYDAWFVLSRSDYVDSPNDYRCCGFSVRPVTE